MRTFAVVLALLSCAVAPTPQTKQSPIAPGVSLGHITVVDNAVPYVVADRIEGTCGWAVFTHLEMLDVSTGKARWSTTEWTMPVAQLPDGDLVVINGSPRSTAKLSAAVLRRKDGSVRATCSTTLSATRMQVGWMLKQQRDDVLVGQTVKVRPPSGIAQPMEAEASLAFHTTGDDCELLVDVLGPVVGDRPWPEFSPRSEETFAGVVITSRDGVLSGKRNDVTLWKRTLPKTFNGNCNVP